MRDILRTWALQTLPPDLVQLIRTQMLPSGRKLLKSVNTLKKSSVLKKASSNPDSALVLMEMGDLLYKDGQLEEAMGFYEKAIALKPDLFAAHHQLELLVRLNGTEAKKDAKGNLLFDHVSYDLKQASLDKLVACCRRMVETFPDSPEANFKLGNAVLAADGNDTKAIAHFHQANKLKFKEARAQGNPGFIFMASLPRSGSGYAERSLREGLGLRSRDGISALVGWYPQVMLTLPPRALSLQAPEDAVICYHIPASRANLMTLNLSVDKMLVHVRDPRQGLISYVHYVMYLKRTNNIYGLLEARLPENYFLLSLGGQIDWQIENSYLPAAIDWVNGWLDAQHDPGFYPEILFTTHTDLVADHRRYFEAILEFYQIDKSRFKFPARPQFKENTHMRKGSVDEFKEVMTAKQIEKATRMIPERQKTMFGWV